MTVDQEQENDVMQLQSLGNMFRFRKQRVELYCDTLALIVLMKSFAACDENTCWTEHLQNLVTNGCVDFYVWQSLQFLASECQGRNFKLWFPCCTICGEGKKSLNF